MKKTNTAVYVLIILGMLLTGLSGVLSLASGRELDVIGWLQIIGPLVLAVAALMMLVKDRLR
ncbi:hypothetical protein GY12_17270 [Micrococcus luteus]|nr:hypothetical protein GY12_26800 [Micrococcus luteus]KFC49621.1 hypothetical protein GY12_26450 [Micrococcus luteus]KFC49837.1 hypothetical protein GY12_24685 [Micrococcus luteus]KFC49841.1 hypothetical protein GY12_24670 [Micrococcus luteus]KFC49849.1 hypothetical protein GY12_24600 [Micrococcus luteus]